MYKENYNISFEQAKEKGMYKFELNCSIEEAKKKITNKDFEDNQTTIALLTFGNISIQLDVWNYKDKNDLLLEYAIGINCTNLGWISYKEISKKVILSKDLERNMFNELMLFVKNNNLYWSIENE